MRNISSDVKETSPAQPCASNAQPDASKIILAPSKVFFDGYAAALWGSMAGSAFSLCVIMQLLARHCDHTQIVAISIMFGVITFLGCGIHLAFRKIFHRVYGFRDFMRKFSFSCLLGSLMFLIFPILAVLVLAWVKVKSIKEGWSTVLGWLVNDPIALFRHRTC